MRDFSFVDSTPGDGVVTSYLLSLQGGTAQNSAKNRNILLSKHEGYTVISNIDNGADNALLNNYVLPAVACTPWTVTDLVSGQMIGASVLNQIQSDLDYTQDVPKAQVPLTDAQVLTNGKGNLIKLNAYRAGLYQSLLTMVKPLQDGDPASYCMAMTTYTSNLLGTSPTYFQSFPSPNTNIAANLYDYLVLRFQNSFSTGQRERTTFFPNPTSFFFFIFYLADDLNCATFLNRASPITANLTSTGFVNGTKVTIVLPRNLILFILFKNCPMDVDQRDGVRCLLRVGRVRLRGHCIGSWDCPPPRRPAQHCLYPHLVLRWPRGPPRPELPRDEKAREGSQGEGVRGERVCQPFLIKLASVL